MVAVDEQLVRFFSELLYLLLICLKVMMKLGHLAYFGLLAAGIDIETRKLFISILMKVANTPPSSELKEEINMLSSSL